MRPIELVFSQWHHGQLMAFSGLDGCTDYPEGLVGRTTAGPAGIEIKHPQECRIQFECDGIGDVLFCGDCFRFKSSAGEIIGVFVDAFHLLIGAPCLVGSVPARLQVITKEDRTLVGTKAHFDAGLIESDLNALWSARTEWLSKQNAVHQKTTGNETAGALPLFRALSLMKTHVCAAEGLIRRRWTTPDRWPHRDMWLWDSAFHAIGWRHLDPALAMEMLDAVFDGQRGDGFIPLRASPVKIEPVMTQPPVLAYGVGKVAEISGDWEWVARVFPKLCAYVEWDLAHRDTDGAGLVEWFIEEFENCRSGESGMDNSPRFDSALQLDAVDFNSFLANECEVLAGFSRRLGYGYEEQKWSRRHQRLCGLINERLWSEKHHFYCDMDPHSGERLTVLSSSGFLPLLCGAASAEQAGWLARHLEDSEMFGTKFPVPSVAVKNRECYSKDMWRGPTWVNMNWLIAEGLERYGMHQQAELIRGVTVGEIERTVRKYGVFFEYFDDRGEIDPPLLLRKGRCAPGENPYNQVIHDFGWTATLYVDLIARKNRAASRGSTLKDGHSSRTVTHC